MKITKEWLNRKEACSGGVKWFLGQDETDGSRVVKKLIGSDAEKNDWANWLTVRLMGRKQFIAYAIYAAEQVVQIYEKEYPKDDRPRKAIEAARAVLNKNTAENRAAARAAGDAAWAAAGAAARIAMQKKILSYGIKLMEEKQ